MEPADPTDAAFSDIIPPEDGDPFVLTPPIRKDDVVAMEKHLRVSIEEGLRVLNEEGTNAFSDRYLNKERAAEKAEGGNEGEETDDDARENAIVKGSPRPYQLAFFDLCKQSNTIVHLGTGQGKTLIALLCIQHFSSDLCAAGGDQVATPGSPVNVLEKTPMRAQKQAWFLVPSVALAVQHTVTIRANLPSFIVATACHTTSTSEKARNALARAHVVVATHGSALDLLRHYGDIFNLGRINLLIFDECHYATGNHGYAQLMEKFYHKMQRVERPRIIGLTASPIINVRNVSPRNLEELMSGLEKMLDARVVCFSDLDKTSKDCLEAINRNVDEMLVEYDSGRTSFLPLPDHKSISLHKSRLKELRQLEDLYKELGPFVTGEYCASLAKELSRSRYEGETAEEYEHMVSHLHALSAFCSRQCECKERGQTDKLVVLGKLLHNLFSSGEKSDGVGLIFVERRITALALHNYFQKRRVTDGSVESRIRCDCLVRQSHQVFKYLHQIHKTGYMSGQCFVRPDCQDVVKQAEEDWLHQTKKIRAVLDGLRSREINLLIATSVVEEGVDVSACSFVIVLDGIKTTKSYVQMKGRARQQNAKFFCFKDTNCRELTVPLQDAQNIDEGVRTFLEQREVHVTSDEAMLAVSSFIHSAPTSSSEEEAIQRGEYLTRQARVDLRSAKSLLNHYFLSIPMDNTARASKDTMTLQMPIYSDTTLILPAHLPPEIRKCQLPQGYAFLRKKRKQEMLALMALVRLHEHMLISDRLLPLKRNDLYQVLLKNVLPKLPPPPIPLSRPKPPTGGAYVKMYLYPLAQGGRYFDQHHEVLKGQGRHLGLLSLSKIPQLPNMSYDHTELGHVHCHLGSEMELRLTAVEWNQCTDFYTVLMNARWRRRTGRRYFSYDSFSSSNSVIPTLVVVALLEDRTVDWTRMENVVADYSRSDSERITAVKSSERSEPRLWAPVYSPNSTYISFSPSDLTCSAPFPDPEYSTYKAYFQEKRGFSVQPMCRLFDVQLFWTLPRNMPPQKPGSSSCCEARLKRQKIDGGGTSAGRALQEGEKSHCRGLRHMHLPEEACMEAPLADASLYLHCVLLPQILYELNRCLVASAFISHCSDRFHKLGMYLKRVKLESIVEALTARSCALEGFSYDRLEYVGDAVLKLLHTNMLLYSPNLKQWTKCLHEGDLTKLRSELGCNERLKCVAVSAGFDRFILTMPLARGLWAPNGLVAKIRDQDIESSTDMVAETDLISPSTKVCADIVESLLGLIYIEFGFQAAVQVAEDIFISLPHDSKEETSGSPSAQLDAMRLKQAERFLGKDKFRNVALLKEALTHASFLLTDVPSYQKLEWVGDAVLCLAAREWVFKKYPSLLVANLVVIETTIVCNETLSHLAWRKGLHGLIQHADPTLPGCIETFALGLRKDGYGLWGTNPPKVLADVVEALIGASHVDRGFSVGQQSALFVIEPVLDSLKSNIDVGKNDGTVKVKEGAMMHPKQVLSEMGSFLKIRVRTEGDIANQFSFPIWRRKGWDKASSHGDEAVCHISCFGIHLAAIAEPSNIVARNRACAVVSETFNRYPDLWEKMQEISTKVAASEK